MSRRRRPNKSSMKLVRNQSKIYMWGMRFGSRVRPMTSLGFSLQIYGPIASYPSPYIRLAQPKRAPLSWPGHHLYQIPEHSEPRKYNHQYRAERLVDFKSQYE